LLDVLVLALNKNKPMLFELIYNSIAEEFVSEKDIIDILNVCREFNTKFKITGCLLFHNREFLQIIEGEKEDILQLYENICNDKRHNNINLIMQGEIEKKMFPDWVMAFKELTDVEMAEISDYKNLRDFVSLIENIDKPTTAKQLFYHISKSIIKN